MREWKRGKKIGLGSGKGHGHTFVSSAVTYLPKEETICTYLLINTAHPPNREQWSLSNPVTDATNYPALTHAQFPHLNKLQNQNKKSK